MARFVQRLQLNRYDADQHYKLALEFYRKHNLEQALVHMTQAIEELPTEAEYFAARGLLYLEDGLDHRAKEDFEKALQLFPYELLAHYGLGAVAYRDGQYKEAIEHFNNAYRSDPKRPETLYYMAMAYHQLKQEVYALQVMRQAHDLFTDADTRKRDAARWIRVFEKNTGQGG